MSVAEDRVTVRIRPASMSSDGRAVARLDSGRVVFVDGALPGETVTARLEHDKRSWSAARLIDVESPSPLRVVPTCPRVGAGCGGCDWAHIDVRAQSQLKSALIAEALERIGRIPDPPVSAGIDLGPWRGRTTIRAGVVDGRVALRRGASHDLVVIEGCLVAHPLLLPYLAGPSYPQARELLARCGARTGEVLVAVTPASAGRHLPEEVRVGHFHEQAAGRRWRVSARSFFQSRPDGADALASLVVEAAGSGRGGRAVDLYCGVGLFAGALADAGWTVTAVEGSSRSVDDARVNLAGTGTRVLQADVGRWPPEAAGLVVADPSRAGLGRRGAAAVAATGASRVILVSCDVASLARDSGLLAGLGYRLVSVTPVEMFPHTSHIETVGVFDRRPPSRPRTPPATSQPAGSGRPSR